MKKLFVRRKNCLCRKKIVFVQPNVSKITGQLKGLQIELSVAPKEIRFTTQITKIAKHRAHSVLVSYFINHSFNNLIGGVLYHEFNNEMQHFARQKKG